MPTAKGSRAEPSLGLRGRALPGKGEPSRDRPCPAGPCRAETWGGLPCHAKVGEYR